MSEPNCKHGLPRSECAQCFNEFGIPVDAYLDAREDRAFADLRASGGTVEAMRLFDLPLTSVLDGERIDLGLGIGTLRHAAENHPGLYNPDRPTEPAVDVTDATEFAKAVIEEINREDDEGNTLLTRMIDKAILQAVENGCEGVNHDA